jgi:hypothetical protein
MSRQARRAKERRRGGLARNRRAQQRKTFIFWGGLAILVIAAIIAIVATKHQTPEAIKNSSDSAKKLLTGPAGPEGIPMEIGAPLGSTLGATGQAVDGIQCQPNEQVVYHIHAHLSMFVNGTMRPLPPGIGIVQPQPDTSSSLPFFNATSCYYWMHVHAQDGVIHVESPTQTTYTLGQFFDLWQEQLSKTQLATAKGKLTVYVNGKRFTGDPRSIALKSREDIQIDVGKVVPPEKVNWSPSHL